MTTKDFSQYDPEVPLYCSKHPSEQTYLRCGKCDRPICARCRVSTPAGFRCTECANLQVLPTYAIGADYIVRALLAGLLGAAVTGVLMGIFPGFEFWAALLMGIIVPEAITLSANGKRGQRLQTIAIGCIAFGFVLSRVVIRAFPLLIPLGGINLPGLSGIRPLDNMGLFVTQYTILWFAMAVFLAYRRLQ